VETAVDALARCVRKGGSAECAAAARALALLFLTAVTDDEDRYQDVWPTLQDACRQQSNPQAQADVRLASCMHTANALHANASAACHYPPDTHIHTHTHTHTHAHTYT
jgi:hypothetical protein